MFRKKSFCIWTLVGAFIFAVWVLGFGPAAKFGNAFAQQASPTESKGLTRTVLTTVDLGSEIAGMQGRQLELRMVTIEPGGIAGIHSHQDLPGVAYVLKGSITEHRGDATKEYQAGDSFNEIGSHWFDNKGTIPVVVIVGIITKKQ